MVHGHRPDDVHVRDVKLLEQLERRCQINPS